MNLNEGLQLLETIERAREFVKEHTADDWEGLLAARLHHAQKMLEEETVVTREVRRKVPINHLLIAVQDFDREVRAIPREVEGLWAAREVFVKRSQDRFRARMKALGLDEFIDYDNPDGEVKTPRGGGF